MRFGDSLSSPFEAARGEPFYLSFGGRIAVFAGFGDWKPHDFLGWDYDCLTRHRVPTCSCFAIHAHQPTNPRQYKHAVLFYFRKIQVFEKPVRKHGAILWLTSAC